MGIVYAAEDTLLRRPVAIKVLPNTISSSRGRFRREAIAVARLSHPGIVPVHDFGELADGRMFFVMKLVEGNTLEHLLGANSPRRPEISGWLQSFVQICQTVAYAHSRPELLLHRDLKPSNVMIGPFGEVLVMDWGLARVTNRQEDAGTPGTATAVETTGPSVPESVPSPGEPDAPTATALGPPPLDASTGRSALLGTRGPVGTWAYMAPEQARGQHDRVGPPADVFALGGILCRMLTGQPTWVGPDARSRAVAGDMAEPVARLEGCGASPLLIAIAIKCLAPEPADRYPDAGDLAQAVRGYLDSVQEQLKHAERLAERRRQQARQMVAATVAVAVIVGLGVWGYQWQHKKRALAEADGKLQILLTRADAEEAAFRRASHAVYQRGSIQRAQEYLIEAETIVRTAPFDDQRVKDVEARRARCDEDMVLYTWIDRSRMELQQLIDEVRHLAREGPGNPQQGQDGDDWLKGDEIEKPCRMMFNTFGLDVDAPPTPLAVERWQRMPQSEVQVLIDLLTYWVELRKARKQNWDKLLALADTLDMPESDSSVVRDLIVNSNTRQLRQCRRICGSLLYTAALAFVPLDQYEMRFLAVVFRLSQSGPNRLREPDMHLVRHTLARMGVYLEHLEPDVQLDNPPPDLPG